MGISTGVAENPYDAGRLQTHRTLAQLPKPLGSTLEHARQTINPPLAV